MINEIERINKRFENHDLFNIRDDILAIEMRNLLKVYRNKEQREKILDKLDENKLTFFCNECGKEYFQEEEPMKCECGMDNFGIMD